jgi:hypothetical protein
MLIAAIGHLFAFPYKEYAGANARPSGGFKESLIHALKFNDFYHDTVHQVTRILDAHSLYFVLKYSHFNCSFVVLKLYQPNKLHSCVV